MKIGTDICSDDVTITEFSVKYTQGLAEDQDERKYPEGEQSLTIEAYDCGDGPCFRLHTGKAGWDFENTEEFIAILNDYAKRYKCD